MTKNEIIDGIYRDPYYQQVLKNICNSDLYKDDLLQEVILILLEKPDELIQQLYEENKLINFFTYLCKINYRSSTSDFYRKYKRTNDRIHMDVTVNGENSLDISTDEIEDDLDQIKVNDFDIKSYIITNNILTWGETELFLFYYEIDKDSFMNSFVDKNTYRDIAKSINKSTNYIQKQINNIKYKIMKTLINDDTYKHLVNNDLYTSINNIIKL